MVGPKVEFLFAHLNLRFLERFRGVMESEVQRGRVQRPLMVESNPTSTMSWARG